MQKLQQMKNKKGFTLVELIVVIVIIAILAAVAVPMMMKYVGDAKESSKQAAVDVVTTAANAAASAIEGKLGSAASDIVAELKLLLPKHDISDLTGASLTVLPKTDNTKIITVEFTMTGSKITGVKSVTASGTGW